MYRQRWDLNLRLCSSGFLTTSLLPWVPLQKWRGAVIPPHIVPGLLSRLPPCLSSLTGSIPHEWQRPTAAVQLGASSSSCLSSRIEAVYLLSDFTFGWLLKAPSSITPSWTLNLFHDAWHYRRGSKWARRMECFGCIVWGRLCGGGKTELLEFS